MGGGVALNFGLRYPELAAGLVVAARSGTVGREEFLATCERQARAYETRGVEAKVEYFAGLPREGTFWLVVGGQPSPHLCATRARRLPPVVAIVRCRTFGRLLRDCSLDGLDG